MRSAAPSDQIEQFDDGVRNVAAVGRSGLTSISKSLIATCLLGPQSRSARRAQFA